jgi:hypothetical protein
MLNIKILEYWCEILCVLLFEAISRFCFRLSRFAKMLNNDRRVGRLLLLFLVFSRRLLSVAVSFLFVFLRCFIYSSYLLFLCLSSVFLCVVSFVYLIVLWYGCCC